MPEVIAEALVELRPTMNEAETKRRIESTVDRASQRMRPVDVPLDDSGAMAKLQGIGTAVKGLFAVEGVRRGLQVFGDMANAAGDLGEAQSAVNAVFGEGADAVEEFADRSAYSLGLSERAALEAAVGFGGMTTKLGVSADAAARLSTLMTSLAGDLASQRNLPIADAITKIQSGLAGEAEPLRRFGTDLSEAAVQAKGLELNLADANGELSQHAKVLARAAIITESLESAHGDAAKTADSLANSQRALSAAMEDLRASFGAGVAPELAVFVRALADLAERMAEAREEAEKSPNFFQKLVQAWRENYGVASGAHALAEQQKKDLEDNADATDAYTDSAELFAEAAEQMNKRIEEQTEALADLAAATFDVVDADFARRSAAISVDDATERLAETERELGDAMRGSGKFADDATRAAERLADAHDALGDAQQRVKELTDDVSDAQEKYNEAVFHFGPGSREARDALRELEKAQYELGEGREGESEAQRRIGDAQREADAVTNRDEAIAEAAEKVEEARLRLEEAVLRAARAEGAFADASGTTKTAQDREKDAVIATRDALQRYAETLEGPVKTAVENRIRDLDALLGRMAMVTDSPWGSGPSPAQAQLAQDGGLSAGPRIAVGGSAGLEQIVTGGLGGDVQAKSVVVNINYPMPADQLWAQLGLRAEYEARTAG